MSSSRSQTPTISQPFSRWICETWESAIFPQPTMATLSTMSLASAAGEEATHCVTGGHCRRPAQSLLDLRVRISGLLPVGMPASRVERWGELAFRPVRVLLPETTEHVAQRVRDVEGREGPNVPLVRAQKLSTRRQVVVHDIENLTVNVRRQSRQNDSVGTVVYVGQGDGVRTAHVQKEAEGADADAVRYPLVAGTVHGARPDDHVGDAELSTELSHDL